MPFLDVALAFALGAGADELLDAPVCPPWLPECWGCGGSIAGVTEDGVGGGCGLALLPGRGESSVDALFLPFSVICRCASL